MKGSRCGSGCSGCRHARWCGKKIILMMHFPPMNDKQEDSAFTALFREYPIKKVIYGHLHGAASHKTAFEGKREGIDYALIAADYIAFCPRRIL